METWFMYLLIAIIVAFIVTGLECLKRLLMKYSRNVSKKKLSCV